MRIPSKKKNAVVTRDTTDSIRTGPDRADSTGTESVLRLQRLIGNAAVSSLLKGGRTGRPLIGPTGDIQEREADRVADQIAQLPEPVDRRTAVSRQLAAKPSAESSESNTMAESLVDSARRGGRPLPPPTRRFFESRFGRDFSQVRIHTDSKAARATSAIAARAFTLGHDVVFGGGQYAPETSSGRHLLAHELTHVVQQQGDAGVIQCKKKDKKKSRGKPKEELRGEPKAESSEGSIETGSEAAESVDAEKDPREMVDSTIKFFEGQAEHYQDDSVTIAPAQAGAVLDTWQSMVDSSKEISDTKFPFDTLLGPKLESTYVDAVEALISKAASESGESTGELYGDYGDHIPGWALQRVHNRETVRGKTNFLTEQANELGEEDSQLDEVRFNKLILDWYYEIVTTEKGIDPGDNALRNALHESYFDAIRILMSKAASALGKSEDDLYRENTGRIPMWAWQKPHRLVDRISSPIEQSEDVVVAGGRATYTISQGVTAVIEPDSFACKNLDKPAETRVQYHIDSYNPPAVTWTIATCYQDKSVLAQERGYKDLGQEVPDLTQGYGRGTTREDIAGAMVDRRSSTVGFHEGHHGLETIAYLRDNPTPLPTGKSNWTADLDRYQKDLMDFTEQRTHCVGTTIDTYRQKYPVKGYQPVCK